jgi:hypothetical protein
MAEADRVRPPSGAAPPVRATVRGEELDLLALAREICRRYRAEFPDEEGRYGDAGVAWCVHDNQHILNWAAGSIEGYVDLERELAWLARVLEARAFPLDRLARNLDIGAAVAGEPLAAALASGAAFLRSRESFLE